MSLTPPPKVRKLQDALHSKAKDAPGYRFYALYDKLYREDILRFAYDRCKANGGAPGVDGQSFEDIEAQGLGAWLSALTEELRKETIPILDQLVSKGNILGDGRPGPVPTAGDPLHQGSRGPDGGCPGAGADLRGGPATRTARVSPRICAALDAVRKNTAMPRAGHTDAIQGDLLAGYFDRYSTSPRS